MTKVLRGRTAIRRVDYSRPVKVALESGLLVPDKTFFDYGCGHGDDLTRLTAAGFTTYGWDPAHRSTAGLRKADIVSLGYVVNVIEDPRERAKVVRHAWSFAGDLLIVGARMTFEQPGLSRSKRRGDGWVTSRQTFQKFFGQDELRKWINSALGVEAVPACPGVMFVFRNESDRQDYLSTRFTGRRTVPKLRECDVLFDAHTELIDWLCEFYERRGRIPVDVECPVLPEVKSAFGSLKRAFLVVRRVTGDGRWTAAARRRHDELCIYLGLERFGRRPRMGEMSPELQRDIRQHFGSYRRGCREADRLLFAAGKLDVVAKAMDGATVGKTTQSAYYCHVSVLAQLAPVLRVYEGCARRFYGRAGDANVIKLNRLKPQVSYLEYPGFEVDGHPTLARSHTVSLQSFQVRLRDYRQYGNPPLLHRKDSLIDPANPLHKRFRRLTEAEERHGLLDDRARIGMLEGWRAVLKDHGKQVRGHQLVAK